MTETPPPAGSAEVLCEARGISHDFRLPSGKSLRVLEDVDLAIGPNQVVALLGPSGCGKSTLLRILAGLLAPTQGWVRYHGEPLHGLSPGVAIVFQSFALFPWMTVEQNVRTVLEARGVPDEEIQARVVSVIHRVGLGGFEEAFPRELSGGMKQRVGMARALVVDPELLFMDEPFSQVDALTAETLRAEVIDIWAALDRNPSSILMVSHDIREVAYMADRIVVLGANPGVVRTVVENRLPRPRDYRSAELGRLIDQLHEIITGTELPDVPEPAAPGPPPLEPLPDATPIEIVGLLEYLDARGGSDDLFRIVADTQREFGRVISVVKAAEMLDFVDTPKRLVLLTPDGQRFLKAGPEDRKTIWNEQLLKLRVFRDIASVMAREAHHEVDRDFVLDMLALGLPEENLERLFENVVAWAQFGDLFEYDDTRERLLQTQATPAS